MLFNNNQKLRSIFITCLLSLIVFELIQFSFPQYRRLPVLEDEGPIEIKLLDGRKRMFRPVHLDGVFTFSNVCVEILPNPFQTNVHGIDFIVTQRITIYDRSQMRMGKQRLYIDGPPGHPFNWYDVHFVKHLLPLEKLSMTSNIAYFVSSRCPGNLHHFFEEEYIPLYSVVRLSNMLFAGAGNAVIYPTPPTTHNTFCRNYSTYDEIVGTLHTNWFHGVYLNVPSNTCFRKAVFGSRKILNDSRDVVDHLIRSYNLLETCSHDKANYVTIISRKDRRILNIGDLFGWILESGFERQSVRIVEFRKLSIRKQMTVACTSRVMIGINGAALQWSMLMPEGSHVVEMSWPSHSLSFFFKCFLPAYRLNYHPVELRDVRFNWKSYFIRTRNGRRYGAEEIEEMTKSPPEDLWKWSDAFLHKDELYPKLKNISDSILKKRHSPFRFS